MTLINKEMRRDWLSVLVNAPRDDLARHAARALAGHRFETLRAPEVGLAMVRARIDGAGDRFNLGEATLTRCVVRLHGTDGEQTLGVGYRLGRDEERVRWIAQFDALLQHGAHRADLLAAVIEPLREGLRRQRAEERARTDTSRVRFFTLQAEHV